MNGLVDGIAAAVDGSSSLAIGGDDITGLVADGRAAALGGERIPGGDAPLIRGSAAALP